MRQKSKHKRVCVKNHHIMPHFLIFYVLQDFVLKIAYGRSKKNRKKKGVKSSIFLFYKPQSILREMYKQA